jgi:1-acyl-sn-glycerol-3-phosphate acyltransferase
MTKLCARIIVFVGPFMIYKKVRPQVDYTKYLGPGWKPEYEGASTLVANHSSWLDICLITIFKFPSFTPKMGIKKWPFIGEITGLVFDSYFINRAGTAEERQKIVEEISARQKLSEKGLAPPFIMYPEGCTTNNT